MNAPEASARLNLQRILPEGAATRFDDGALRITLQLTVYDLRAVFRAAYWLTEKAYVYLSRPSDDRLEVTLIAKSGDSTATDQLGWKFLDDLVDHQLRVMLHRETATVRDLIVTQAFIDVDVVQSPAAQPANTKSAEMPEAIRRWQPAP